MSRQPDDPEKIVKAFYTTHGWVADGGVTQDAKLFEDLRPAAADYVRKCRLRVLRHIPARGENMLDMASGPIQYPEYLEYSRGFTVRHCVDLSKDALAQAEQQIGIHGRFYEASFFDVEFTRDFFDCSISLHTIYHIDKDKQEQAVRKILEVTKPGAPAIIVYSNPNTVLGLLVKPLRRIVGFLRRPTRPSANQPPLYFYAHGIGWWKRFEDVADVRIFPWRSFSVPVQRLLFPNNFLGRAMLTWLFWGEDRLPWLFARYFQYPMIVLVKR